MEPFALIADIHANAPALAAALAHIAGQGVREIVCAGDLVGYNAQPAETLALLREHAVRSVAGNHDRMVVGDAPEGPVGPRARRAIDWTRRTLNATDRAFLAALPWTLRIDDEVCCMHSLPGNPWPRLDRPEQLGAVAPALRESFPGTRLFLVGHSHRAHATLVKHDGAACVINGGRVSLASGDGAWFVNPGSIGEPRDGDLRAAYAIIDWPRREVRFHRVSYDAARVARTNLERFPALAQPDRPIAAAMRHLRHAALRVGSHRWMP